MSSFDVLLWHLVQHNIGNVYSTICVSPEPYPCCPDILGQCRAFKGDLHSSHLHVSLLASKYILGDQHTSNRTSKVQPEVHLIWSGTLVPSQLQVLESCLFGLKKDLSSTYGWSICLMLVCVTATVSTLC